MSAVPENIKQRVEVFASGIDLLVYQLYGLTEKENDCRREIRHKIKKYLFKFFD